MILHGLTDPTTILATGRRSDDATDQSDVSGLAAGAAVATVLLIAAGFILLVFVRGSVHAREGEHAEAAATA